MNLKIDKIIRSNRKTIALEVDYKSNVIVKAPKHICDHEINNFVLKHNDWILKRKNVNFEKNKKLNLLEYNFHRKPEYKKKARSILKNKARYFADIMKLKFKIIKISDAKKRWGSCSNKDTLNFNWRLIFAPEIIIDYVVVHELCHLKHLDHSKNFWNEVIKMIPDYKIRRKWLNENDYLMIID
ncbi:hypothetical protein A2V49_03880 [candidate division WWE3 bacterium RBG_19FT_COMBO_34_6]|uniref:YgjP-like metallopeptidase domain-containing protein n=1 Tax=candidate division WWE3 bacterium RBG_19FT_COMBO_34_6 TaxID=1802612 RepID=A0A1F4UKW8_UNCKA|nr:MAG: hypothetical protein A2V49_03880 [candidate division WWE3 bacterium RBG_19FT_COMBO_34_6]